MKLLPHSKPDCEIISLSRINSGVQHQNHLHSVRLPDHEITQKKNVARYAQTNAAQLEMAILNLAVNARDAMPSGGIFSMTTRHSSERGFVDLVVSDTGIGMTETVAAHALEPYFTTKESGKGTGLRLSQVHVLVQQSGGVLLLDTAPGKGT